MLDLSFQSLKLPSLHSIMALLKLQTRAEQKTDYSALNSIMALLKFTQCDEGSLASHFKFHYGIIKIFIILTTTKGGAFLYIPLWYY